MGFRQAGEEQSKSGVGRNLVHKDLCMTFYKFFQSNTCTKRGLECQPQYCFGAEDSE